MGNGIAGHAVYLGGRVQVLDTIDIAQDSRGRLAGSGLFPWIESSKGELAAGTHPQHTADNALLSHTYTNQRMRVTVLLQEFHHRHAIIERVRRVYDRDDIGGVLLHLGESFFQLPGVAKVMRRED